MITEDYVSFETAKLLKEKGFDWCESPFYSEQDRDEWRQNNSYTIPNMEYNPDLPFDSEALTLVAPHVSIQMAMKWLREVYNVFIDISSRFSKNADKDVCFSYSCKKLIDTYKSSYEIGDGEWLNYEEAVEAAIKHCLKNLI